MALTKTHRRRAPLDGTWFQTTANLNSVLRAQSHYNDDMTWPSLADQCQVPAWLSMRLYKAQETRKNPSGMIYGPVMKLGTLESVEVEMFGYHHNAGLFYDYTLDMGNDDRPDRWMYRPYGYGHATPPGEDVSIYYCDKCRNGLYRDEMGRRHSNSACIFGGALVCRDCDVTGLVYDAETEAQLLRARRLADHVGPDCRKHLDRLIGESLAGGFCFGTPCQTRLYREDKFSFNWGTVRFTKEGKQRGMHGGLIQHGPHPIEGEDGFTFRTYDYGLQAERDATEEEVRGIHWSIHT
jgi:hypothetical protein